MVGTFNALPMVPLDGGFIMKEGIAGLLRRIGKPQFIDRVVLTISMVIFALILLIVTIPSIAGLVTAIGP
jgi:membrane-associated protease RseP (regulator of RpoE activity)